MSRYRYKAAPRFWKSFRKLNPRQQEAARKAWEKFKENPFHPSLRTHKIHQLSTVYGRTIHAVVIEGDLRAVFYVEGDEVWSVDIGSHAIYRA